MGKQMFYFEEEAIYTTISAPVYGNQYWLKGTQERDLTLAQFPVNWLLVPSPTQTDMYYIRAHDREMYIHAFEGSLTLHPCVVWEIADSPNCQWLIEPSQTQGKYYIRASNSETYIKMVPTPGNRSK